MSRRKTQKWGDEFQQYSLLGQALSNKIKYLPDYACNKNALKLVVLDLYLEGVDSEVDKRLIEGLKKLRVALKRQGEALWVMDADILTNLALKVGKKVKRFNPEADEELK